MKNVLIVGTRIRLDEFRKVELKNANLSLLDQFYLDLEEMDVPIDMMEKPDDEYFIDNLDVAAYDVVFDLSLDDHPTNLDFYADNEGQVVFACAVKMSLAQLVHDMAMEIDCTLVGLNSLPTFINRPRFELSLLREADRAGIEDLLQQFGREFEFVDDRVGMVTPRIVCMIINEACFVLKEGTAGIPEVDRAMKLGTNYPHGPFEWADKMGIHNVYDVVAALKEDTGEEKYKMAPLLKQYYLREESFYS
ncbi:MAG: 3-hydroxyacyl-CoA dehydrogenase family protein [Bacteroidota bacterium]